MASKTFLFTDIEGSTRLWERVPETMRAALARHDELLREIVTANGGTVFKTVGDAFCCAFDDSARALEAAVEAQRRLASEPWPAEIGALRVRAGLHTGEAEERENDYFGPTLNRVARLMSVGHGGQILLSAATEAELHGRLGTVVLRDLGSHRLKDLGRAELVYQAVADGLSAEFPPLASLDAHPNNLPMQISSFVGRERELERVRDLIEHHRLVSVAGPGGIGKTRLALQAAADVSGSFRDGCWFVGLGEIDDAALVAQAIADALRLRGAPSEPVEQTLIEHLERRRALLVLDNAEHLRSGVPSLVRKILEACAEPRIIVTTREPLHVAGEHVARIGALDEARALFLDRARAAKPNVARTADEIAIVDAICAKLEGIPLAIELAAARASSLSLRQLEERLSKQLALLASKDASLVERRRTLRGTIDWSYRLLTPGEQRFFDRLSVFEGSFTLDACECVAWDEDDGDLAIDVLESLVDKSLVAHDGDSDTSRYQLLFALRGYAAERLAESAEAPAALRRLIAYYRNFAERVTAEFEGRTEALIAAVDQEWHNVRRALQAALDEGLDRDAAFAIVLTLAPVWNESGRYAEGLDWVRKALAAADPADPRRMALLMQGASFAHLKGDGDAQMQYSFDLLHASEASGDPLAYGRALTGVGIAKYHGGEGEQARDYFARSLEQFRICGNKELIGTALMNLGTVAGDYLFDRPAQAAYYEEALRIFRDIGPSRKLAAVLRNLSATADGLGDHRQALAYSLEAIEMLERLGNFGEMAPEFTNLIDIYRELGELDAAREAVRSAHRSLSDLPNVRNRIYFIESAAILAIELGMNELAATIFGFAEAARTKYGLPHMPRELATVEQYRAKLAERVGAAAFERLGAAGAAARQDELDVMIEKLFPDAR